MSQQIKPALKPLYQRSKVLQFLVGIGALILRNYGNFAIMVFLVIVFAGFAATSYLVRRTVNRVKHVKEGSSFLQNI